MFTLNVFRYLPHLQLTVSHVNQLWFRKQVKAGMLLCTPPGAGGGVWRL